MPEKLLDTIQAAEILGVEERTLEVWRWKKVGPQFVRFSNRLIRYRPSDIQKYIEEYVVQTTNEPVSTAA